MKLPCCFFFSILLTSCATTGALKEQVLKRATFDLSCTESKIQLTEIGNDTYGAMGCDKKATYIIDCKNSYAISCKVIMNSDTNKK